MKYQWSLLLLLLVLFIGGCGWGVVDPGERAVFARFGKVEEHCFKEGLYFYNPFTTDMYELDIKVQAFEAKKLTAASRDLQEIHADLVLNFSIDGTKCHELLTRVGTDFKERIIIPAITEVLKAATAHFPIEKVIQERPKLKAEILDGLRIRLDPYYIIVQDVALTNFDFSSEFAKAIERKQVEEQNVQRFEFLRQQAVKQAEARVAITRGEAEANKMLAESLKQSPETLRFKELEMMEKKWDGRYPMVVGGAIPFLNMESPKPGGSR